MNKNEIAQNALRFLAARCRRLTSMCYWAGTSSIAIEELGHRESFDLDFHTHQALTEASRARDRLLSWLKTPTHRERESDE